MTRVFLRPDAATIEANNGIGRVVHAQAKYLPRFDIELVNSPDQAEVVAGHTHDHGAGRLDACHLHGLYWFGDRGSGDYTPWHREANTRIIASVRRARALTVPSAWVAEPFKRDLRVTPTVIPHGIEFDEWAPGEDRGYVLWGKNRNGDVCDPRFAWALARRGVPVVSTFLPNANFLPDAGDKPPSMTITGALSAADMKPLIQNAGVYLATVKETFGIQTLEAMASGVPVLGFDWGGTADLVRHLETGYLVEPGDVEGLLAGLAYVRGHRAELSANARAAARGYTWEAAGEQYAALYHALARTPDPATVAVVITNHNYAAYVGACLESVLAQTYPVDEIVVIDDGSTDDSRRVLERFESDRVRANLRFVVQPNQGVATARNNGVAATRAAFVMCLDADDQLDPRYIAACREALVSDRGLGLAWTGLSILRDGRAATGNVWTGTFDWEWQATPGVPPRTSIPTGAMFRRALFDRAGGYRQQYAPGEDAEFYTRGLSVGFTARQVTDLPLYLYRDHGSGAHKTRPYTDISEWHPWMRDRDYPLGAPSLVAPDVRSYSEPKVSVIIPVGPGHARYLPEALDSLVGQNLREWEVIVVNDSDEVLPLDRFPFAKRAAWIYVGAGPGAARNKGLEAARAPLVLFLDADDQLAPGALAAMMRAYADAGGRYIFGDWQAMGETAANSEGEYDPAAWLDFEHFDRKHAVTVLMDREQARALAFDTELAAWEDWDFFARAALAGMHGQHVNAVTLYVRRSQNGRTARAFHAPQAILHTLKDRYGGRAMSPCTTCGGNAQSIIAAKEAWAGVPAERAGSLSVQHAVGGRASLPAPMDVNQIQPVRMEFVGNRTGNVTYHGVRGTGRFYRGGRNPTSRFANVHPADAAELESTGHWRRVAPALIEAIQAPEAAPLLTAAAPAAEERPQLVVEKFPPKAEPPAAPVVQAIETGAGVVKRQRKTGKSRGQSELRDLPPLDGAP